MAAANGSSRWKNFVENRGPSLEYLEKERAKLEVLLESYKTTKLPQLAEVLAAETLSIDKNCRLKKLSDDVVNDFGRAAKDAVNSEVIQSEINHVLLRAAQIYQGPHRRRPLLLLHLLRVGKGRSGAVVRFGGRSSVRGGQQERRRAHRNST
jgi:hypothetical protein